MSGDMTKRQLQGAMNNCGPLENLLILHAKRSEVLISGNCGVDIRGG